MKEMLQWLKDTFCIKLFNPLRALQKWDFLAKINCILSKKRSRGKHFKLCAWLRYVQTQLELQTNLEMVCPCKHKFAQAKQDVYINESLLTYTN